MKLITGLFGWVEKWPIFEYIGEYPATRYWTAWTFTILITSFVLFLMALMVLYIVGYALNIREQHNLILQNLKLPT